MESQAGDVTAAEGESRWPPTITVVLLIGLLLLIPDRFSLGPRWLSPVLLSALLVALAVADPGRIDRRSSWSRGLGIVLLVVLAISTLSTTVALVIDLVNGTYELNNPTTLLV